ncbi:MarR family winged helix-turn-helix transcriptional regulator [Nocardia sp. NPDC004722]
MEDLPVDPNALGTLLYRAHLLARAAANRAARPSGIELQHAGVLAAVADGHSRTQRELGAALGIDKSTLVRIVDDLEHRGLVVRRRNPHDRRAYEIVITETGAQRLSEASGYFRDAVGGLLRVLDNQQQHQLHTLLTLFVEQDD